MGVNAGNATTRPRQPAVAAFQTLLDEAVCRGDGKHRQELRDRLYRNLAVCCAAPEQGARTCECATLVKLLHLPRDCPVSDPRHVSEEYQEKFLKGCQPREEGQSSSAVEDHVNDDPPACSRGARPRRTARAVHNSLVLPKEAVPWKGCFSGVPEGSILQSYAWPRALSTPCRASDCSPPLGLQHE
ncbi:hypothetical protein KFL_002770070 [Klebsormidium nitens]|uniref:Uncharacterized protein n=1 Tax=Klebsormidium nitens TaxID=105231 RepID=A0A1Y1I5J7_KLENI|nr:hypothetical protein KFL_002770070 [Klebsormidium nitens]|eukprot:GAQ86230.1 hypothetical protein KFL_002770070 [Klebsormidium nitens]